MKIKTRTIDRLGTVVLIVTLLLWLSVEGLIFFSEGKSLRTGRTINVRKEMTLLRWAALVPIFGLFIKIHTKTL